MQCVNRFQQFLSKLINYKLQIRTEIRTEQKKEYFKKSTLFVKENLYLPPTSYIIGNGFRLSISISNSNISNRFYCCFLNIYVILLLF